MTYKIYATYDDPIWEKAEELEKKDTEPVQKNNSKSPPLGFIDPDENQPEHDAFSQKLKKIVNDEREKNKEAMPEDDPMTTYELKRDIKAQLILLERPKTLGSRALSAMGNVMEPDWEDVGDEIFKGRFPDQQISMFHLFNETLQGGQVNRGKFERTVKTTLEDELCPRRLRYYHIPVNNMQWAERAIASYFNESYSEQGHDFGPSTKLVLRDDCWRGQEHGNEPHSMVHNRHLRPMDEAFEDPLIKALRNSLLEKARAQEIPQILQEFVPNQAVGQKEQPAFDWDNALWRIKEAGKGYPTPHALEDIFWEQIKKARKTADRRRGLKDDSDQDPEESQVEHTADHLSHSTGAGKKRYGMSYKDESGVHQSIRTRVKTRSNPDNHVRSIFDLALIILDECFNTFFNRARTADKRPQVMDMFAESIGRVTHKQAVAFKHLWSLSERLTAIYQRGVEDKFDPAIYQSEVEDKVDPRIMLALLDVTPEAELQREIRDIIDELDIMLHIVGQQQEVIRRFVRFAEDVLGPNPAKSPGQVASDVPVDVQGMVADQIKSFETRKAELLSEVADRIKELKGLKASALSTAENVNDLLSLKQQQASVVQAYEAMKQGEETVRQGKAIMVFTVMTILFLPLSFMSSLFGMNAVELTGSDPSPGAGDDSRPIPDEIKSFWPITFKRQILIMFTVSFGAVLAVIIPAFSPFARAAAGSALRYAAARAATAAPLYRFWLGRGWSSVRLRARAGAAVRDMKHAVREAMRRQRLEESEIRDGVRKGAPPAVGGLFGPRPRRRRGMSRGGGDGA
ncbi:putative ankyrin repeat protein [Diaporthe ampelina]|uniref:Putative ankyrin repeat protein n=1 Tax=Diaporthe ampelina TaxID=1214573 RepID=A0A0G2FWQ3_9PEZI|nr:putative ankyrin repeat protein [Diaporthe ampelina]